MKLSNRTRWLLVTLYWVIAFAAVLWVDWLHAKGD